MQETRNYIYQQIEAFRHDAGHIINWKGIVLNANSLPPHIKKNIMAVRNDMIAENLLEEKNGNDFLTQKGYDEIYFNTVEREAEPRILSEQEKNEIHRRFAALNEKLTQALSGVGDSNVSGNFHKHIDDLLEAMTKALQDLGVNI